MLLDALLEDMDDVEATLYEMLLLYWGISETLRSIARLSFCCWNSKTAIKSSLKVSSDVVVKPA